MAEEDESESLETEVEQALEEARMVLPGIQALFGFQLIVFRRFKALALCGLLVCVGIHAQLAKV